MRVHTARYDPDDMGDPCYSTAKKKLHARFSMGMHWTTAKQTGFVPASISMPEVAYTRAPLTSREGKGYLSLRIENCS